MQPHIPVLRINNMESIAKFSGFKEFTFSVTQTCKNIFLYSKQFATFSLIFKPINHIFLSTKQIAIFSSFKRVEVTFLCSKDYQHFLSANIFAMLVWNMFLSCKDYQQSSIFNNLQQFPILKPVSTFFYPPNTLQHF